ncbi:uncharacterized protein LOC142646169 [Dermatophagoides pteronyssinus]|uniref:uncharacterized protein LOC142646169 n=1 Tax=Dermatophagoides pteronyssinus TaxID=6956 RepID=UPI003F666114
MKSEDDQQCNNHGYNGSNSIFKANKLTRKRVMRRKNAVRRIHQIHDEFSVINNFNYHHHHHNNQNQLNVGNFNQIVLANNLPNDNDNLEFGNNDNDYNNGDSSKLFSTKINRNVSLLKMIIFTTNPTYHRIYSTS